MDPIFNKIDFAPCTVNDLRIDFKNSPAARVKKLFAEGLSHWEVAGSSIAPEIFFHILEFLSLKEQVKLTLVCKAFYRNVRGLLPVTCRMDLLKNLQKITWDPAWYPRVYAKFRGAYLLTIHNIEGGQKIDGYTVSNSEVRHVDSRRLTGTEGLWFGSGDPLSPLLNMHGNCPRISTVAFPDRLLVAVKDEVGFPRSIIRTLFLSSRFALEESKPISYLSWDSEDNLYTLFRDKTYQIRTTAKVEKTYIWSENPTDPVCAQQIPQDRMLFMGASSEGSIWKCFPEYKLIKYFKIPATGPLKGAVAIQRNSLQLLVFPRLGKNSILYDLETQAEIRKFPHDFSVSCYHRFGKNLLWLGYEDKVVKLWDLRKKSFPINFVLKSIPLDFRYDPKACILYIATEMGLLSIPINGLSDLDA